MGKQGVSNEGNPGRKLADSEMERKEKRHEEKKYISSCSSSQSFVFNSGVHSVEYGYEFQRNRKVENTADKEKEQGGKEETDIDVITVIMKK